jgi:branched-chain amino acid transport system permease protein
MKQSYLSPGTVDVYTVKAGRNRITRHPFFGFIIFGIGMILVQVLQKFGLVNYSFAKALGQTAIYGIAALGFSFLLGYAGLSSLGTAGFAGLGAYLTGFLFSMCQV